MKKIITTINYQLGNVVEPMENSFIALKTKNNTAGIIYWGDIICLSKEAFSEYYKPEEDEKEADLTVTAVEDRTWENWPYNPDKKSYTLRTLTVRSSVTNKEYYLGLWSDQYLPVIKRRA